MHCLHLTYFLLCFTDVFSLFEVHFECTKLKRVKLSMSELLTRTNLNISNVYFAFKAQKIYLILHLFPCDNQYLFYQRFIRYLFSSLATAIEDQKSNQEKGNLFSFAEVEQKFLTRVYS